MYTQFAEIYDELMSDVDYEVWADQYARLMDGFGIGPRSHICECACGTGNLTIPLRKRGFVITGVDLSQDMLWIAAQKAREAAQMIPFVRQDMRSLRLHRPVDAILSTCDGVNYLMQEEDLSSFFTSAYASLRPGGGLFFDLSTPYKLQNLLGDRLICQDTDHITFFWQNHYHENRCSVDMELSFFVKEKDGRYRRIDEEQKQRSYSFETLKTLLERAGFVDCACFGNVSLRIPTEHEERWFISARKPAEA
ncbi:MAG: class I SAM-dependent methyltransferase [Clostridia bacterium]|nr:class I SAM-dependent methyltransferase [Clostridia bacterium]